MRKEGDRGAEPADGARRKPRRWHRSRLFWLGLVPLGFLIWLWFRSYLSPSTLEIGAPARAIQFTLINGALVGPESSFPDPFASDSPLRVEHWKVGAPQRTDLRIFPPAFVARRSVVHEVEVSYEPFIEPGGDLALLEVSDPFAPYVETHPSRTALWLTVSIYLLFLAGLMALRQGALKRRCARE